MSDDNVQIRGVPRKRPIKVGTVSTVNVETGEVISEKANTFAVLPPKHGCPECGVDHPHDQPHSQQSLAYQYQFYGKNGRWPTWTDAMAHCSDAVRAAWRATLVKLMREKGITIPNDLLNDTPRGRPA